MNIYSQNGMATLIIAATLSIIMGVMGLTVGSTGLVEQRNTGNNIRSKEVQEAAWAGNEYGSSWANNNLITSSITCTGTKDPAQCPPTLPSVTGSTTQEAYKYTINYTVMADVIKVTTTATGVKDNSINAVSESFIKQIHQELFKPGIEMPPPWVMKGCIEKITGKPTAFILESDNSIAVSGTSSDSSCLPQDHLQAKQWTDYNGNGIMDAGEEGGVVDFNRGKFDGCPSTNCAWNHAFQMDLNDAISAATNAGNVFTNNIPCGAPAKSPSIYVLNNSGNINTGNITGTCSGEGIDSKTIGTPPTPVLIIVPTAYGCPRINGGVTIYGIVYYQTPDQCQANGWGGATMYGSIVWEGDVGSPNANSQFIEKKYTKYGDLNTVFGMNIDDSTTIPGTWKDF